MICESWILLRDHKIADVKIRSDRIDEIIGSYPSIMYNIEITIICKKY